MGGVLAALVVLVYLAYLNPVPDVRIDQAHDSLIYHRLAKSLNAGEGFPTKHWMPGFPWLLGQGLRLFGTDFFWLKLSMVALSFAGLAVVYLYVRAIDAHCLALPVTLLVAVNPLVFDYGHRLMSEIPALALSMLALAAVEMVRRTNGDRRQWSLWTGILIAAGAASLLVRGNALALVPALGLLALHGWRSDRSLRNACLLGVAAVVLPFVVWTIRGQHVEFEGIDNVTYLQEVQTRDVAALWQASGESRDIGRLGLGELAERVYRNLVWFQGYNIASCVIPGAHQLRELEGRPLRIGLMLLCSLPVALGVPRLLKISPAGGVYLLGSLVLILIYPTGHAARMLLPSVPLLAIAGALGLRPILGTRLLQGWLWGAVAAGLVGCALAGDEQARHPYSLPGFENVVALLEQAEAQADQLPEFLVSRETLAVRGLTNYRIRSWPDVLAALHHGEIAEFLLLETPQFQPLASEAGRLETQLVTEQGTARLLRVRLAR